MAPGKEENFFSRESRASVPVDISSSHEPQTLCKKSGVIYNRELSLSEKIPSSSALIGNTAFQKTSLSEIGIRLIFEIRIGYVGVCRFCHCCGCGHGIIKSKVCSACLSELKRMAGNFMIADCKVGVDPRHFLRYIAEIRRTSAAP